MPNPSGDRATNLLNHLESVLAEQETLEAEGAVLGERIAKANIALIELTARCAGVATRKAILVLQLQELGIKV